MVLGNFSQVSVCLLIASSWSMASPGFSAEDATKESADQRFESLLTKARTEPKKADWKALRAAFAETSHYDPYNIEVTKSLEKIAKAIGRGETKASEGALLKLLERERFMRIDTVAMLLNLYQKTKQPAKAEPLEEIVQGILGVLEAPKAGTSFETPIEVLFIEEEYLVTNNMTVAGRALVPHDGHRFDVFQIKGEGDKVVREVYFQIDLPQKAMSRKLEPPK